MLGSISICRVSIIYIKGCSNKGSRKYIILSTIRHSIRIAILIIIIIIIIISGYRTIVVFIKKYSKTNQLISINLTTLMVVSNNVTNKHNYKNKVKIINNNTNTINNKIIINNKAMNNKIISNKIINNRIIKVMDLLVKNSM